ncbi:tyrosine-type recombinase/integrase [Sphingomonas faeni]|uniref:tyrosine-type recombinase/integrase n=1 Tax=Sphingomonas faeni TaxID=185950 RepID=UPI00334FAE56
MAKLTKLMVGTMTTHDKEFLWDDEVKGFGIRFLGSGRRVWVYRYRDENNRWRQLKVGEVGVLPLGSAREQARSAAAKVQMGGDPAAERDAKRRALTVRQLAEVFDDRHIALWVKASTAAEYRRSLKTYILPEIGSKRVDEVTRQDVARIHRDLGHKPTQANRTIEVISKMFSLAEEWGYRPEGTNPRKGVKKYPENKRERFLSAAELARVGEVLAEMEAERIEMPSAIAAIRLLMLTGCRLNEIMTLQWRYIDYQHGLLRLPDSKTGAKDVPVGAPALTLLHSLPHPDGNDWVLPGKFPGGRLTDLQPFWQRVRSRAGLKDARIHDLRHTFASVAAAAGMSLLVIGKILGHSSEQTTKRYAHLARGTVRDAANDVSAAIFGSMSPITNRTVAID